MIIPDDVLLDADKFDQILESLGKEACNWGRSHRDKNLKERYWNAPQDIYLTLKVRWDYRATANCFNWEASDDYRLASSLYECESRHLFSFLSQNHNLEYDHIFNEVTENIFLRVVGHWEMGMALTPPILKLNEDRKLGKIDGYHRLAVAYATKATRIPFWAVLPASFPSVKKLSQ